MRGGESPGGGQKSCDNGMDRVIREIGDKWTISWKYYSETRYPRYNPGAFYIVSRDLLNRLFNYVYIRKPFHVDDAYIGVAMRDFGVNVTKISSFVIRTNMSQRILKTSHCDILRLHAFGHNMEPESTRFLNNRLKALACGQKKIKCDVRVKPQRVKKNKNNQRASLETRNRLGREENPDSRKTRTRTRKKSGLVFEKTRT